MVTILRKSTPTTTLPMTRILLTSIAAASLALPALAADDSAAQPVTPPSNPTESTRPGRPQRGPVDRIGEMLKRFDKDGDGSLSDDERKAAAAAARERFNGGKSDDATKPASGFGGAKGGAEALANLEKLLEKPGPRILQRFDSDKDGKLSDSEKQAARDSLAKTNPAPDSPAPNRAEIIKRFDKDGDGKLNESEQTAAREEMKNRVRAATGEGPEAEATRKALRERLDSNKDGQIDESERAALRDLRKAAAGN